MNQVDIITAIKDKDLFRPLFRDLKTWVAWFTFLKALYALPMDSEEIKLYQQCTGRKKLPKKEFKEAYMICGRRGGKSYIAALIAVYLALFGQFEQYLSPGETGYIFCFGTDKRQAKIILDFCKAFLSLFPDAIEPDGILTWEIRLRKKINISVKTGNYKAGRGFSTCAIILDELAFYRSEESVNPAEELVNSLLPGLLPNGLLLGLSTPYSKWGYLYEIFKNYYAKEQDDILVFKGSTLLMNPTYQESIIKRLIKRDRAKMTSEYMAEFRADIEAFLSEDLIDKSMKEGYFEKLPKPSIIYEAFTDSSGGRGQDSFTLGIAHQQDGIVTVDKVVEAKPPFNPEQITKYFSEILKKYRCWKVQGDRYAAGFVADNFRKEGIVYKEFELTKSELYIESQGMFTMEKIKLPKDDKLKTQLLCLERKTRSGGKDSVDHPTGGHDDCCNAALGSAVSIYRKMGQSSEEILAQRRPILSSRPETTFQKEAQKRRTMEQQMRRDILRELREEELGTTKESIARRE